MKQQGILGTWSITLILVIALLMSAFPVGMSEVHSSVADIDDFHSLVDGVSEVTSPGVTSPQVIVPPKELELETCAMDVHPLPLH